MTRVSRVAMRYSASFFEAAESERRLDQVETDLKSLWDLLTSSDQLREALANPTIPRDQVDGLLTDIAKKLKLQPITHNFLRLLAQKRRANILVEIITHFEELVRNKNNQLRVDVTARTALNKKQLSAMEAALSAKTGKKILLNVNIDEDIIGGIIVNYGSYKLDFSLKSKLNALKHELERLG